MYKADIGEDKSPKICDGQLKDTPKYITADNLNVNYKWEKEDQKEEHLSLTSLNSSTVVLPQLSEGNWFTTYSIWDTVWEINVWLIIFLKLSS